MRGRPGPGALIGLVVGASLVFLLLWLPAALMGDPSTDTGIIVFMGLPLMVISTAVGGLIGVPSPLAADGHGEAARRPPLRSRAVVGMVAGAALIGAEWFFLMAIGAVPSLL